MKNFKIYKSALAILTSASILLLSGCGEDSNKSKQEKQENPKSCNHLTIYFEDEPITFKECEGYKINIGREGYSSEIEYKIKKDSETVFNGITTNYNSYSVYHELADEIIENKSIKKVK